jgi:glyoxylase-like metal-dependent hydrolase (beta-lactamase superfamily II)
LGAGERPSLETIISVPGGPRANHLRMLTSSGAHDLVAAIAAHVDHDSQDGTIWEYPDTWLSDAMRIQVPGRALDVIDTPGHTSGHVSLMDAEAGLFFAGDHVLPHITPSIAMEVVSRPLPLKDFLSSLARVRDIPVTQVLPAHGLPFANLSRRVDELMAHHRDRLSASLRAVADGASTAFAVARTLQWTRRQVSYEALDMFNRQLAVRETIAHLDLLVDQRALTRSVNGKVRIYAPQLGAKEDQDG